MENKFIINFIIVHNNGLNQICNNNIILLKSFIIFSIVFIFIYIYKILMYLKFYKQLINTFFFNDYNKQNKSNNINKNITNSNSPPLSNPEDKKKNKKKNKEVNKKSSEKKYRKRDILLTIATTIFFGVLIYIFFKGNGSGGNNPSDLGPSSPSLSNGSQTKIFLKTTNIETLSIIGSAALAIISQHFSIIKEIEDTSLTQESINALANMGSEYMFNMKYSDPKIISQATKEFHAFLDLINNNLDIENIRKIEKRMEYINNVNNAQQELYRISNLIDSYMANHGKNVISRQTIKDILSNDYVNYDDKYFITKTVSEAEYCSYMSALKAYCHKVDDSGRFYKEICELANLKKSIKAY